MKHKIKITTNSNKTQWLYSQDWEYYDYGDCKRYLQIIFPYKSQMRKDEKYPLSCLFRVLLGINRKCTMIFRSIRFLLNEDLYLPQWSTGSPILLMHSEQEVYGMG